MLTDKLEEALTDQYDDDPVQVRNITISSFITMYRFIFNLFIFVCCFRGV